jgi:hypothetical protein
MRDDSDWAAIESGITTGQQYATLVFFLKGGGQQTGVPERGME